MNQRHGFSTPPAFALAVAVLVGAHLPVGAQENVDAKPQPHLKRKGPNLLPNPSVKGAAGYEVPGDAAYDDQRSRSPGSGSIRIKTPWQFKGSSASTDYIEIAPNKQYTFACYMYSKVWPVLAQCNVRLYDAAKKRTREAASRYGTTRAGAWEECVVTITTGPNDRYLRCSVGRAQFADNSDYFWADDWYLGEGIGFEQPPAPKKAFRGGLTRVDELGNFEILQNGAWKPFFPFSICVDARRPDWSVLVKQGFNCNTWATSVDQIRKAKAAGMMSAIDLNRWALFASYREYPGLEQFIQGVKKAGLMDGVLFYYMDNEYYQYFKDRPDSERWEVPLKVIETVRKNDPDHPIFMLTGNYGMARMYTGLADVVGAYVGGGNTGGADGGFTSPLTILANIQGQTAPLMGQINGNVDRVALYQIIIAGGKGFSHWKDNARGPSEARSWWAGLPQLRQEVERLLPLIRQPHWTAWQLTSSEASLTVGTRNYRGEGYAIVLNGRAAPVKTTFAIHGLSYTPKAVRDYFTDQVVAPVSDQSFTVALEGRATAVYRLEAPHVGARPTK
jgi:hypothetical protein